MQIKERRDVVVFWAFAALFFIGLTWSLVRVYFKYTTFSPAYGGEFKEGTTGSIRYINPILPDTSETEAALEALIFSSLFRFDGNGGIVADLAEDYTVSEDRKEYFVTLKDRIFWHDGVEINADDVLFTLDLIKNPALSSHLFPIWQGIKVEKISDRTIKFTLDSPYEFFLQNLTFKILPRHLWAKIPIENFHLAELNLKPIGSGPYRFRSVLKDQMGNIITYTLSANPNYFNSRPYIDTIKFKFYKTNNDALVAFKKGEVDALSTLSPEEAENIDKSNLHYLNTTKDFILFFNVESTILKDKRVREALAKSFNIEKFSKEVLRDSGITFQNFSDYDIDYAKTLLNKAGWKEINSDGIRIKSSGKNKIKFSLTLFVPSGEIHRKTAEFLKNTWREIGLELNISILDPAEISSIVRSRSYDMILFGAIFGPEQDLFPLWHSSHSRYPGLNLSQFKNKNLDKILETLRKEPDVNKRNTLRQQANNIIQENFPGIILYSQYYIYALSPKIHADSYLPKIIVSPEERFLNINKWFIITKRKWVGLGR